MPFILQSLGESWDVRLLIDRDKNYVVLMCIRTIIVLFIPHTVMFADLSLYIFIFMLFS